MLRVPILRASAGVSKRPGGRRGSVIPAHAGIQKLDSAAGGLGNDHTLRGGPD